jgi:hypothetical protein
MKIQDRIKQLQDLIDDGFVYMDSSSKITTLSKEYDIKIERFAWVNLTTWNEEENEEDIVATIKCELRNIDIDSWYEEGLVFNLKPIDELPSDFSHEKYDVDWNNVYEHQIAYFQINNKQE